MIDLKESMYYLFSQYGRVLDVVALKTMPARGQAFICFDQIQEATNAKRTLQGFPVFGKALVP